jgi:hypothetical protein
VPTLFWMNASGNRAAMAWMARQPVQCDETAPAHVRDERLVVEDQRVGLPLPVPVRLMVVWRELEPAHVLDQAVLAVGSSAMGSIVASRKSGHESMRVAGTAVARDERRLSRAARAAAEVGRGACRPRAASPSARPAVWMTRRPQG